MIDSTGGSRGEILRRSELHELTGKKESGNPVSQTQYQVTSLSDYVVPVSLYGCETWSITKYLYDHLDAFDVSEDTPNTTHPSYD